MDFEPQTFEYRLSDEDERYLAGHLGDLPDLSRAELGWWVGQRGARDYGPEPPPLTAGRAPTTYELMRWLKESAPKYGSANEALYYYFLSAVDEPSEESERVLRHPTTAQLALTDLMPLPAWAQSSELAARLGRFDLELESK